MERLWLVSYGAAWLLAVAQALSLVALLWVLGRIHLRRSPRTQALITEEGPEIHAPLPELEGRDATGRLVRSGDYRGRELALLLLSPDCAPCDQVARAIPAVRRDTYSPPEFLVVLDAPPREAAAYRNRHALGCAVIADEAGIVAGHLGVDRTPYGFLIDAEGVVRMKGVINDRWQLEGLIGRRGRRLSSPSWSVEAGQQPAPAEAAGGGAA